MLRARTPPPAYVDVEDSRNTFELTLSCRNLNHALYFKANPRIITYTEKPDTKKWIKYGETEAISNSLNPDFVKKLVINFYFEEQQNLRFDVIDTASNSLSNDTQLGHATCTLGDILKKNKFTAPLKDNSKGEIIILAEELDSSKDVISMQFYGEKLDKKNLFGKSDPYMVFSRCNEDNSFTVCHKTEKIKNTLNPNWKLIEVPVRTICNGDPDRTIKVEVYSGYHDGGDKLIGNFPTTLNKLKRGPGENNDYKCIHPELKEKKKNYNHSGIIKLFKFEIEKQHTFLQFRQGGTELSFVVAIDFTKSNGNPKEHTSLHFVTPDQPNQYEMAIRAVGEIVQQYQWDKRFPTFGFGARLPPDGKIAHRFPLNGDPTNPDCYGIEGVLEAYRSSLNRVQLYLPTNFAPIISHVASMAARCPGSSCYYVLLMITDGVITDMEATKEEIVNASRLPMSIIIIGVGTEDFEAMKEIDGDAVQMAHQDFGAERGIVQFVPLRDYFNKEGRTTGLFWENRLRKDVLAKIPDQLVTYMKLNKIKPEGEQLPAHNTFW